MKRLLIAAAFSLFSLQPLHADKVHVPKAGSPERKAIMDGLRGWLKDNKHCVGQDVVFMVDHLKVHDGWAWVSATPQTRKEGRILAETGTWLLRFKNGSWKSVDYPDDVDGERDPKFLEKLRKTYPDIPADIFE